jgi:hypothetical protein
MARETRKRGLYCTKCVHENLSLLWGQSQSPWLHSRLASGNWFLGGIAGFNTCFKMITLWSGLHCPSTRTVLLWVLCQLPLQCGDSVCMSPVWAALSFPLLLPVAPFLTPGVASPHSLTALHSAADSSCELSLRAPWPPPVLTAQISNPVSSPQEGLWALPGFLLSLLNLKVSRQHAGL